MYAGPDRTGCSGTAAYCRSCVSESTGSCAPPCDAAAGQRPTAGAVCRRAPGAARLPVTLQHLPVTLQRDSGERGLWETLAAAPGRQSRQPDRWLGADSGRKRQLRAPLVSCVGWDRATESAACLVRGMGSGDSGHCCIGVHWLRRDLCDSPCKKGTTVYQTVNPSPNCFHCPQD